MFLDHKHTHQIVSFISQSVICNFGNTCKSSFYWISLNCFVPIKKYGFLSETELLKNYLIKRRKKDKFLTILSPQIQVFKQTMSYVSREINLLVISQHCILWEVALEHSEKLLMKLCFTEFYMFLNLIGSLHDSLGNLLQRI